MQIQGNQPILLNDPNVVWKVESGSLALFAVKLVQSSPVGSRRYLFTAETGTVLLGIENDTRGILAVALEETELKSFSWDEFQKQENATILLSHWTQQLHIESSLEEEDITLEILQTIHNSFLQHLQSLEEEETATEWNRFQAREKLNEQVTFGAIAQLASLLSPQTPIPIDATSPLLSAVGAVGKALGVAINPPAKSEDLKRVKDPLEAIVRASRIRSRRVLLSGNWWTKDAGPFLAYTRNDKHPVALLPIASGKYAVFNPISLTRIRVTPQIAEEIDPIAYTFYRPLPDKSLTAWDLLQFALKGQGRNLFRVVLTGVGFTLLGMLTPLATAILIDTAIPNANYTLLIQVGLGLFAAAIGSAIFQLGQGFARLRFETTTDTTTQAAVWNRLLNLQPSFFRSYSTGDLQSRVSAIAQMRQLLSGTTLRSLLTSFFSLLNLVLLFYYSPTLAWVAVLVAIVVIFITTLSGIITQRKLLPLQTLEGEIFGLIVQLIGGVSKLRIAGAEERAFAYWAKKYTQQLKLTLSTQGIEDFVTVFNLILPTLSSILLFLLATNLIQAGTELSIGVFLAFSVAFGIFISGVTDLSNTVLNVLEINILWERAKPILQAPPEVNSSKADPGRLKGNLALERVFFRYSEGGSLVLDNLSLSAKSGQFIAIVGPSGSGKSTILRLLLGFNTPESGTISYDGQDLSGLDITAVRRQLGVVVQNGRINSASIFDNISGGALITMDEAWTAAQMAGLADDIATMPMGMHTVISEGGSNISGGQRQRLLIARSLVLQPKILLFDEATSSLDNRTQAIVSESISRLNVTRIVIAHRLSTIRNADKIYVLNKGGVVQEGNFDTLMKEEGLFRTLMSRQMA